MDNSDYYYCCISSHMSVCNCSMGSNMSDTSFNTIIMNDSHDPQNDDGQASAVHPDVAVQFMYKMCYDLQVIF